MAVSRSLVRSARRVSATRLRSGLRKYRATFKAVLVSKFRHATLRHAHGPRGFRQRPSAGDPPVGRYELQKRYVRRGRIGRVTRPASLSCNLALRYGIRAKSARGFLRKTLAMGATLTTGKTVLASDCRSCPQCGRRFRGATKKTRSEPSGDDSGPGKKIAPRLGGIITERTPHLFMGREIAKSTDAYRAGSVSARSAP